MSNKLNRLRVQLYSVNMIYCISFRNLPRTSQTPSYISQVTCRLHWERADFVFPTFLYQIAGLTFVINILLFLFFSASAFTYSYWPLVTNVYLLQKLSQCYMKSTVDTDCMKSNRLKSTW